MTNFARLALVLFLPAASSAPAGARERATPAQLAAAREYVRRGWRTLTRSERDPLSAATDPKFESTLSAEQGVPPRLLRWPVYVARVESLAAIRRRLGARMTAEGFARVELRRLPERAAEATPGLLYLPRPYVVPGGRFDEMYGWDGYFIQVGPLRDGELALARDLADNFVYEVGHYGPAGRTRPSRSRTRNCRPPGGRRFSTLTASASAGVDPRHGRRPRASEFL